MGLFGPPNVEKMKARADVEGLIKALSYRKDADVREGAAKALGDLRAKAALEPLIAALEDPDSDVQVASVKSLGKIGDSRAAKPLLPILKGEIGLRLQQAAAEAFRGIELSQYPSVQAWHAVVAQDWERASALGSPSVEPLGDALRDRRPGVAAAAAEALGRIGAPAADSLVAALFRPASSGTPIVPQVTDALAEIGAPAVHKLVPFLESGDARARGAAADVLVRIGAPAVEPLIAVLRGSGRCDVATTAAEVLGRIKDARAVDPLVAALKGPLLVGADVLEKALVQIGAPAVDPLISELDDPHSGVRGTALRVLDQIRDVRAVESLAAALKDENRRMRYEAASALGRVGDSRAVEALIAVVRCDEDHEVRGAAARGLRQLYHSCDLSLEQRRGILSFMSQLGAIHRDAAGTHHDVDAGPHQDVEANPRCDIDHTDTRHSDVVTAHEDIQTEVDFPL